MHVQDVTEPAKLLWTVRTAAVRNPLNMKTSLLKCVFVAITKDTLKTSALSVKELGKPLKTIFL